MAVHSHLSKRNVLAIARRRASTKPLAMVIRTSHTPGKKHRKSPLELRVRVDLLGQNLNNATSTANERGWVRVMDVMSQGTGMHGDGRNDCFQQQICKVYCFFDDPPASIEPGRDGRRRQRSTGSSYEQFIPSGTSPASHSQRWRTPPPACAALTLWPRSLGNPLAGSDLPPPRGTLGKPAKWASKQPSRQTRRHVTVAKGIEEDTGEPREREY